MTCLAAPPLLGLRLGDSVASLRSMRAPPVDSVLLADENDPRRIVEITYRFPTADVRVADGRVDRIVVTSPAGWPRGLAVGSTQSEVDQYTGRHRLLRIASGNAVEIEVCPGAGNRALLHFTPSAKGRRVSRVELLARGA